MFAVRRADIEGFARDLEARGRARATVTRRLSTIAGFHQYAVEEELLGSSPAAHVRRPRVDYESHAVALDRNELGALLVAAGLGTPGEHALISLLALNGLRVSEATSADIEHLGLERGHRTLTITRKGGKIVTIPLAPHTARAIDLAIGEHTEGPLFLAKDGQRLDRHGAGRIVRKTARRAGIAKTVTPHTLRHAFITAALDAGVPLRDVQEAASHADPRTTVRPGPRQPSYRALCTPAKECLRVRWMHPIAGGPMPSGDEIRDVQRATWAGLSAGWEKWDSVIMDQPGPVGTAIIERLDIADDQQHLDIAAGTGEPGLTVAKLAPRGHVVLTDLAAEMLDIATRRANAQGITNFETKVCSADDLPFGAAIFDSISVRFGYLFFPDVAKATAEFARVLKPGGRLCSSVWVKPEENPWTTIAMQAIATEAVLAPPDPDGPNMFRCAAPGYVSALYETAGLRDVAEWTVDVELVTRSPAQYWEMISEHVSLAVAALQQVDEPARERIAKAVIAKVSTYEEDGKVRIPGVARCIVGTK